MLPPVDLVRRDYLSACASVLMVYGVGVVLLGGAFATLVALFVQHRRRAAPTWPREVARPGLVPGPTVLRGRVARADNVAVDVVLADGTPVRCAPSKLLLRADGLDEHGAMVCAAPEGPARLRVGERVAVSGVLATQAAPGAESGGYRDAAERWALRPPAHGLGAMLVTTAPLVDRAAQAAAHGAAQWLVRLAVALVGLHVVVLGDYHALAARGEVVEATVTGSLMRATRAPMRRDEVLPRRDGPAVPRATVCIVYAEYAAAARTLYFVEDEVDCRAFRRFETPTVPFLIARGMRGVSQLGASPRIPMWKAVAVVLCGLLALAGYRNATSRDPHEP